jgi:hypothetical protein
MRAFGVPITSPGRSTWSGWFRRSRSSRTRFSVDHALDSHRLRIVIEYGRIYDSIARDGGNLIDYARINKITLQAWPPFHKKCQDEVLLDPPDQELNAELSRLASK